MKQVYYENEHDTEDVFRYHITVLQGMANSVHRQAGAASWIQHNAVCVFPQLFLFYFAWNMPTLLQYEQCLGIMCLFRVGSQGVRKENMLGNKACFSFPVFIDSSKYFFSFKNSQDDLAHFTVRLFFFPFFIYLFTSRTCRQFSGRAFSQYVQSPESNPWNFKKPREKKFRRRQTSY